MASLPLTNPERLILLNRLGLLDSPLEPAFDRLTRLASRLLKAPVALVSLVDADRQFFKSQVGLPEPWATERQTPLSHSFCQHVVNSGQPLIVEDARLHLLVADNLAIQDLNVIAYAGMPLEMSTGEVLGSFCVIDSQARQWTEEELATLKDLTASVITEIELRAELIERHKLAAKLRAQEKSYRTISEMVSDYWYSLSVQDGVEQLAWLAGAFSQTTGYSTEEIQQIGLETLYLPEDKELRTTARYKLYATGSYMGEIRIRTKTGELRWLRMSARLSQDGEEKVIYEAYKNITSHKLAEQALILSESKLRTVIQHTSDLVFLKDREYRYQLANAAFANLFHISEADIVGMDDVELFGEVAAPSVQAVDAEVMTSGLSKTYEGMRLVNGVERVFLTTKSPYFNEAGEVVGLVGITRDISARQELEVQLRQTIAQERHLNDLKSRFVSMISHEFRNPLSTINTSILLLRDYRDRLSLDDQLIRINKIHTQIGRLTDLLDDILLVGKAEAMGTNFCPTLIDIGEFCRVIVDDMADTTSTHRIDFTVTGPTKGIYADLKLLQYILNNLLSNAIKYSPLANLVGLTLDYRANGVVLRVRDEGIGIPANDLNHLFEAFHRGENVGKIAGTGLGMVIIQQAVRAHSGSLTCESEVGKGTTFQVTLPYEQPSTFNQQQTLLLMK